MVTDHNSHSRPGVIHVLVSIGGRTAIATLRPLSGAVNAAAGAGIDLERRAVDRLLEGGELERLLGSARFQAAVKQVLESEGAKQLVDVFFASGLLDRFLDRLGNSDALWNLVDEIAGSPAVTAAISQQGLGYADQVGDAVRTRSRKADDWLERAAARLIGRRQGDPPPEPGTATP
jgi:hypothetical protein